MENMRVQKSALVSKWKVMLRRLRLTILKEVVRGQE